MARWTFAAALAVWAGCAAAQTRPIAIPYQLTYSYNMDGVPSPDGKSMVFIRIVEGREQLFLRALDGTAERQITRDGNNYTPAWSN